MQAEVVYMLGFSGENSNFQNVVRLPLTRFLSAQDVVWPRSKIPGLMSFKGMIGKHRLLDLWELLLALRSRHFGPLDWRFEMPSSPFPTCARAQTQITAEAMTFGVTEAPRAQA